MGFAQRTDEMAHSFGSGLCELCDCRLEHGRVQALDAPSDGEVGDGVTGQLCDATEIVGRPELGEDGVGGAGEDGLEDVARSGLAHDGVDVARSFERFIWLRGCMPDQFLR